MRSPFLLLFFTLVITTFAMMMVVVMVVLAAPFTFSSPPTTTPATRKPGTVPSRARTDERSEWPSATPLAASGVHAPTARARQCVQLHGGVHLHGRPPAIRLQVTVY